MHVPRLSSITSAIAHLGVLPFLSFLIIATSAATPDTRPTGEPIAKLQPGKESGTFHLIYHTNAVFSVQGQCPLKVGISDLLHHEFTPTHMAGSGPFTVELDLRPGTYQLIVLPADPEKADYWPSDWQRLHIDKQGLLYRPRGWLSQSLDFVLDRRIRCMPDDLAIADTRQPMLKWPKVNGAAHYRGSFMTDKQTRDQFDVEETQYVIGGGISPGEWCYWSVTALDASGKTLARGEGRFYGHETDPALIAQVRAEAAACAVDPPSGQPYLGFQPIGTQVPKDPATPLPGPDSHMVMDFSSGFIPGVQVMEVLPGSPALDAGLVPDDVVIAIDGKRIPSDPGMNLGDARAFVAQISAIQPGTNVVLTVRRFPRELLLHATIGRFGMPTGSVAATTMPAPPAAIALAAAAANTDGTWTNVDAGKPAEFAFRPQPGVEHLRLSTAEGLGGDDVGTIAELSERRMAFGSRGGLSIWDGSRIRTFTGPSYSPRGGQSNGNSGLPSNDIQDLLFDKRGRLWVATSFGVCRIDGTHWRSLGNPDHGFQSARGLDASCDTEKLFEASDGSIVVGGRCATIRLIDQKTDKPKLLHGDQDMNHWVTGIAQDAQHHLWFSILGVGVLRYDGVHVLYADSKGTVWVATSGEGLIGLDPGGAVRRYNNDLASAKSVIYCLVETPDGMLYAGTQQGVYRLRGQNWEHLDSDLFQVGQMVVDHRSRVWMLEVTYSKVYVYDGQRFREVKEQTDLANEPIEWGSLRLDGSGGVLVDVLAQPVRNLPRRTFRWDATGETIAAPKQVAISGTDATR